MNELKALLLDQKISFHLYACSKEVVTLYKPYLAKYDLTYTQYLVMAVLWQKKEMNVKMLGAHLYLDSGTLTPLLRKLESKGYILRERSRDDERNVIIRITPMGIDLEPQVKDIPNQILMRLNIPTTEREDLKKSLQKLLSRLEELKQE